MRNPHHKKVGAPSVESSHFDKPGETERERKKGKEIGWIKNSKGSTGSFREEERKKRSGYTEAETVI